jgi:hypothetical protein
VASYRLQIKPSAEEELLAVPSKADRRRIVARIQSLGSERRPPGCIKLAAGDTYRVPQGRHRSGSAGSG